MAYNPKSKENLRQGGNFLSSEFASEMQKKSVVARLENRMKERIFKDDLLAKLGEDEWNAIIQGAIERSKDSKPDLELLLSVMGQKPIDKQQIDMNASVTIEDLFDSIDD